MLDEPAPRSKALNETGRMPVNLAVGHETSGFYSQFHTILLQDTNLVQNVYFAEFFTWQGRCREMFLQEYAPDVLEDLSRDLRLVTLRASCDYFDELRFRDRVEIRTTQSYQRQHRIGLNFDYVVERKARLVLAARGFQEIGCMRLSSSGLAPCLIPPSLSRALEAFAKPA